MIFLQLALFIIANGQEKYANIWYFGGANSGSSLPLNNSAGISFNTVPPTILTDGKMSSYEGCAIISDKNSGELLFYTDGIVVRDKNHDTMPGGIGLKGNLSSSQNAIILPQPDNNDIYYIFTVASVGKDYSHDSTLNYSIVDLSLNNGLGQVVIKNQVLYKPVLEKLTATKSCTGTYYWIISHEINSNNFVAFKLTKNGIEDTVISSIGTVYTGMIGWTKISPNGKKIASTVYNNLDALQLFDFDLGSGEVSNPVNLSAEGGEYGIAFSSDNTKLYTATSTTLIQFDLSAGNGHSDSIINSKIYITESLTGINPNALALAPDQKIYISREGSSFLHIVNEPNKKGLECNFQSNGLYLEGGIAQAGLPNFVDAWMTANISDTMEINVSIDAPSNTCYKDTMTIKSINVNSSLLDYNWYINGVFISNNQSLEIIFNNPDVYNIQLITEENCNIDTTAWNINTTMCDDPFYMANSFSPDGDGLNDYFGIYDERINQYLLHIYNSFGDKVFESKDNSISWDGTYDGKPVAEGVYVYVLEATYNKTINNSSAYLAMKGNVLLVR